MLSSANVPRFGGVLSVLAGVLLIAHGLILILLQSHFWACSGYLAHSFAENDGFPERMCQVATTAILRHQLSLRWQVRKNAASNAS